MTLVLMATAAEVPPSVGTTSCELAAKASDGAERNDPARLLDAHCSRQVALPNSATNFFVEFTLQGDGALTLLSRDLLLTGRSPLTPNRTWING